MPILSVLVAWQRMTTVYSAKLIFHKTGFHYVLFSAITNRILGRVTYKMDIQLMVKDKSD